MLNRAAIVDENFVRRVRAGELPDRSPKYSLADAGLRPTHLVDMFESQVISRRLDILARDLRARGATFYTIGSAGHEGNVAFGKAFPFTDTAFLHYRSGGFFTQRAKQLPGSTSIYDMMLAFAASSDDPIAGGRHKVFGSKALHVPPQTSTIASHLPKAVGAAQAVTRRRELNLPPADGVKDRVIICSFGDASVNHAVAQTAFNHAAWLVFQGRQVPLVFICEDNGIGISVPTPDGWVFASMSQRPGLVYLPCDGRDLVDSFVTGQAARELASKGQPVFVHMRCVRLLGHAGSDVESMYREQSAIDATEADDPLLHSAALLIKTGALDQNGILNLYESIRHRCARVGEEAILRPKLSTADAVQASVIPPRQHVAVPPTPAQEKREKMLGSDAKFVDKPQHAAKLLSWGLADLLLQYDNAVVFGEDVAEKGGVYNVTQGLWQRFGGKRVFNTLLDETSILGNAIGMAQMGLLPIPEIQFLAYVHNAEDQLRGEAATLSFFSCGQFVNPMVVRIAGLAYQKGFGGHFHNDNSLTLFRDLPGVILAVPSRPADAVKMLRGAVEAAHLHGRVVVFVEPIALYMTKDLHKAGDGLWAEQYPAPDEIIRPGEVGKIGDGKDLLIITYGNGTYLSMQAQASLQVGVTILDLRWLVPLPVEKIVETAREFANVLVVDECRDAGSVSEAIVAALTEHLSPLPHVKRITARDCFIPLGEGATLTLPNVNDILRAAAAMPPQSGKKRASRAAPGKG